MDYIVLKTEITTDPKALGYAAKTDREVADKINEVGAGGDTADNDMIPGTSIINAIVPAEYKALAAVDRDLLQLLTSVQMVDIKNANIKAAISSMFGAGTATRTALLALTTKPVSRGDVLGLGKVEYWDVARARAL